jgi:hypothetical protein
MAQTSSTASYSQAPSVALLPKYERPNFIPFNPLNAKLNPICHLLVLLGAHPILYISTIRVKAGNQFWSIVFLNRKWENTNILDKRVTGIS